jgi:two-component system sensor histidine kinase KdpD
MTGAGLRKPGSPLSPRRQALGWVLALGGVALLTLALVPLRGQVGLPTVLLLFLAMVVAAAAAGGRPPAFAAAAAGFLSANWYFTPPFHRLAIDDADNLVDLLVFAGVAGVVSNFVVNAARRAEDAARVRLLAQANELRSALLQAVSHDLRTPLATIKASVSSLTAGDVAWSPGETREFLASIDAETDRLTTLVANLLDMSRLQAGALHPALRPVGLEEVVPAALASLGQRATAVDADLTEELPLVTADPALLERAVANLVDNAVRWSPPGGRVRVEADAFGDQVSLRVVDRGPGIPPAERERVFQPFQRHGDHPAAGTGVGLGLAIARGFLQAMHGGIEIEDTPGGGATLVIRLKSAGGGLVTSEG